MGIPLHRVAEIRAVELSAQSDLPAGTLMARAGAAAAAHICALHPGKRLSVCVVTGPGNNGGDGYAAATELRALQHEVTCVQIAAPVAEDAKREFKRWSESGGTTLVKVPDAKKFDCIVDALLGIGQTRELREPFVSAVRWINAQPTEVIALDVPSGLDADRGSWHAGVEGVRASSTITFIADKPGLHTGDGVDAAGVVALDTLETVVPPSRLWLTTPTSFGQIIKPRRRNTHKGSFGNASVVGGNVGMVGAALLAARAALRIGAGRVYVDCIGAPEFCVDPLQPELMFTSNAPKDRMQALCIGCGLGTDERALHVLRTTLLHSVAVVVDADALNLIAGNTALIAELSSRVAVTVLTPHPLEAARLLGCSAAEIQADRIGAAQRLAERYRSIVILKGAGTVIVSPDGRCAINPTGGPSLATAGTGDVLAGLLCGLLAQGFDPWQVALAAIWLHGRAADDADCDVGLVASDIAQMAARALVQLRRNADAADQ